MAKSVKPTEKELEILQVLWDREPASVKEVHEALGGDARNGYTTILKLLQIMHEKGLVTRKRQGRLHRYAASSSRDHTATFIVDKLIDTVFQGSAAQLVMSALGKGGSSKEEISAIRRYLDELEGGES